MEGSPSPTSSSTSSSSPYFLNPIIRGSNPDPTICRVPAGDPSSLASSSSSLDTYFLCTSTFELFPGAALYASTDLVNWTLVGHALTRRSQLDLRTVEPGAGSWASTLRYRETEKRFYLANGVFMRYRPGTDERIFPRGFYVYTDNIWDSDAWSDPVYFDNPGFDQDLFWDETTNKVYLSTTTRLSPRPPPGPPGRKDFAIHLSEIDLSSGLTLTPPIAIRTSPHGLAEGSHLLRRGAYLYLFTAEGGTEAGHQEWVQRSRDGPRGPWEERGKPLWYNGPDEEEVQRTGHADVFKDGRGEWWAVLLGVRPVRDGEGGFLEPQLGRETFLVKVDWVDDWPVFNDGHNITLRTRGRRPVKQLSDQKEDLPGPVVKWRAALHQDDLELGWYHKNTPLKRCYTLTQRPGFLRLHGNCYDLASPESPAMLLRKQTSYTESFHARLAFNPRRPGYEAGVVLWWNQYSFATVGITLREEEEGEEGLRQPRDSGSGKVRVRAAVCRKPGQADARVVDLDCSSSSRLPRQGGGPEEQRGGEGPSSSDTPPTVDLRIQARPSSYTLSLQCEGATILDGEVPVRGLAVAPPLGAAFGGVMFGLYAFGKGEPVLDPADFSDIFVGEEDY